MLPYTPHPLAVVFYFFVTLVVGVTAQHPFEIFVLLAFVLFVLKRFGTARTIPDLLRLGAVFCLLALLLNLFCNRDGVTLLYEGPNLPFYGRIIFTLESVIFGCMMALKLFLILAVVKMYGLFVPPSTGFSAISRLMPRGAVTVSIATLFVPRLRRRFSESLHVLRMRGEAATGNGLRSRIVALRPAIRMVIATALEDSWKTGEALAARGFGLRAKRSSYRAERWRSFDSILVCCGVVIFLSAMWQHTTQTAEYFPELVAPVTITVVAGSLLFLFASIPALLLMSRSR